MFGNASYSRFLHHGATTPAYYGSDVGIAPTTLAITLGRQYFMPFASGRGGTLDEAWFEVTTGAGTAVARMGLYRATLERTWTTGASLIADFGEKDCSAAGVKLYTAMSVIVPPDCLCFMSLLFGVAGVTVRAVTGEGQPGMMADNSSYRMRGWWYTVQGYGALPASQNLAINAGTALPMMRRHMA